MMSKEALEAIDEIRGQLSVNVEMRTFNDRLIVEVQLRLGDYLISTSSDHVYMPKEIS